MLEVIVETPSLEGLGTFTAAVLVPEVSLEAGGQVWGTSGTGAVQGDPVSGTFQACGIQPSRVTLDRSAGLLEAWQEVGLMMSLLLVHQKW